jgi:hypothetical protein
MMEAQAMAPATAPVAARVMARGLWHEILVGLTRATQERTE